MPVSLPNGATLALATTYASALTVTAASNANPCVLTVNNALSIGDYIEYNSGWSRANGRLFRLSAVSGTTVTVEGLDASSTTLFPAGSGTGSIRKITAFTQVSQVLDLTSSGGDPQYTTYSFLEQDFDTQIPTTTAPQSLTLSIADDATLAGYIALKAAALTRVATGLKMSMPQGGVILYNGILALDETPSLTKNQLMAVKCGFALSNRPVRYTT